MTTPPSSVTKISDSDLIAEVHRLAGCERSATADLLRSLMEFDARRLYLGEGYPSLFAYCTQVLRYAEHAALNRIEVARAARRLPVLLDHVSDGRLNITGARLLAPHVTAENCDALLGAARHKSKREIEEMVAALRPRPEVVPVIRRLPSSRPPTTTALPPAANEARRETASPSSSPVTVAASAPTRAVVAPLAPERFKVQFTITRETRDKLREVQELMRHTVPDGNPATIFARALTILLEDLHRTRFAATPKPLASGSAEAHSRHIPAAVRREVWQRDGGRCAFVGSRGRCAERGFLEFHHVVPFGVGGTATEENIQLRCRSHNTYEAALFFGQPDLVREERAPFDVNSRGLAELTTEIVPVRVSRTKHRQPDRARRRTRSSSVDLWVLCPRPLPHRTTRSCALKPVTHPHDPQPECVDEE